MKRCASVSIIFIGLLIAVTGMASERYDLRLRFREGQSWRFDQSLEMQQTTTMAATPTGSQPGSQTQQRLRQFRKGAVTALGVRNGVPSSVRIRFDQDCAGTLEAGGQQQPIPFPFAGQTITVTRDARGQVQHDFKGLADPIAVMELVDYLPNADAAPRHPVAIGESWQPDTGVMRAALSLGPQDHLSATFRLLAVRQQGRGWVAEVEALLSYGKRQGDMDMQTDMRGVSLVDLTSGNALQVTVSGTSRMQGSQMVMDHAGRSQTVTLSGQGNSQMRRAVWPLADAPVGTMPGPPGPAVMGQAGPAPIRPAPFGTATETGTLRFRKVSVMDRPDMIGGEAMTFLCPADWQVEGGMVWREHPAMPATVHLRAFNPRGLEQVESFPDLGFNYGGMLGPGTFFPIGSNYMGNEVRPPVQTANQYIKEIILPRYRAGVQVQLVGEQDMPQWAQAVAAQEEQAPGPNTFISAGRVRVAYVHAGQAVEEDFYCVLRTVLMPAAGNMVLQVGERAYAMRAARGQLDHRNRIMQTMVTSTRPNLQWFNKYNQLCQILLQIQLQRIKTAGRISQIISQTHNEISDMMHQTWQRRQASEDRIHKQWTQSFRGVEEYYNPIERRPVELPGGYREAWINGQGEYILTDNPNYNPNVEAGGNWQRLQRQR